MAITNLKELVQALNTDAVGITQNQAVSTNAGSLRVNPLAQNLTNIDRITSTVPTAAQPLITVIDSASSAVRTVEDGQSVVLITGPQGLTGPPGAPGTLGADGRNGVGIENIAVSAGGDLLVELDNGTIVDAGTVNLSLSIGSITQGNPVSASITGAGLSTELNIVLPNATALGLGNVTNESKATMFSNPTFTGTVSGVAAAMVGLGAVTNESKLTMFASPAFTGIPTAPTATAGTNTTQLATTQYVRTEVANLVNSAPGALDTLDELAAALGDDASFATTVTTSIGLRAPLESPAFTGTVTGITKTMIGLGNVTNESKATMFTSPTFTGTVTGAVPSGVIVMWSGTIATIPSGWLLCNGANGTPDLRNRFIIGAHSDDSGTAKTTVTGTSTQTGGSKDAIVVSHTHTATVTDPGHNHLTGNPDTTGGSYFGVAGATGGNAGNRDALIGGLVNSNTYVTNTKTTGVTVANSTEGSSGTNANLPPYYALAFIMKS
jgi:hypothetical protein